MTSFYKIKRLEDSELEDAVSLMIAEHPLIIRNTPKKMSDLINNELGFFVSINRLKKFFGLIDENFELESLKIENYGGNTITNINN